MTAETQARFDKTFAADLEACRDGTLEFSELMRRHRGLMIREIRRWEKRCNGLAGIEDLAQESWIEVWRSLGVFDPSRGVPLVAFVRRRFYYRLLSLSDRLVKARRKDVRYLNHQIVSEKVVVRRMAAENDNGSVNSLITIEPSPGEEWLDQHTLAARVIGGLPSRQARVVVGVCQGASAESIGTEVYGHGCKRPRKAVLRAIAAARSLVDSPSSPRKKAQDADHKEAREEAVTITYARRQRATGAGVRGA